MGNINCAQQRQSMAEAKRLEMNTEEAKKRKNSDRVRGSYTRVNLGLFLVTGEIFVK